MEREKERGRERGEREKSRGENDLKYNENNFHNFIPTLTLKNGMNLIHIHVHSPACQTHSDQSLSISVCIAHAEGPRGHRGAYPKIDRSEKKKNDNSGI